MTPHFEHAWQAAADAQQRLATTRLSDLHRSGAAPPGIEFEGMLWDFSRQHLDGAAWSTLKALAGAADLPAWRKRLFAGGIVNPSERRPALHTALRGGAPPAIAPEIATMHTRIRALATAMRARTLRGADGSVLTQVLHVGIGGSRWGPALGTEALADYADPGVTVHYLASLDPRPLHALLRRLNPRATLVLIASKSFTTAETTHHRLALRAWLVAGAGPQAPARQMLALTAQPEAAHAAGFADDTIVSFPQAVGGRYSLWSAVGLPLALAIGPQHWDALLAGAAAADTHFRSAPDDANLPLRLGLLDVWYASFWRLPARAILPYEQRLRLLPAYLQQLYMESCGKSVDRDGVALPYASAPVFFGGDGNEAEHTFMQALHQGTGVIPAEFLVCTGADAHLPGHRLRLIAQCLGQATALAQGAQAAGETYRDCPGNRPSLVTLLPELDPRTLGALLAIYEHRVFVAATVWRVNPFDQWGVELGKRLAGPIEAALAGNDTLQSLDPALALLLERVRAGLGGAT